MEVISHCNLIHLTFSFHSLFHLTAYSLFPSCFLPLEHIRALTHPWVHHTCHLCSAGWTTCHWSVQVIDCSCWGVSVLFLPSVLIYTWQYTLHFYRLVYTETHAYHILWLGLCRYLMCILWAMELCWKVVQVDNTVWNVGMVKKKTNNPAFSHHMLSLCAVKDFKPYRPDDMALAGFVCVTNLSLWGKIKCHSFLFMGKQRAGEGGYSRRTTGV